MTTLTQPGQTHPGVPYTADVALYMGFVARRLMAMKPEDSAYTARLLVDFLHRGAKVKASNADGAAVVELVQQKLAECQPYNPDNHKSGTNLRVEMAFEAFKYCGAVVDFYPAENAAEVLELSARYLKAWAFIQESGVPPKVTAADAQRLFQLMAEWGAEQLAEVSNQPS